MGREHWSGGYWRRLASKRLWVQIPAPDTEWTFLKYIVKVVMFAKKTKNKR